MPPDPEAIQSAEAWIREFAGEVVNDGGTWLRPHVTSSAEGEVVFEWWHGQKELTVYVSAQAARAVKSEETDRDGLDDGDAALATSRAQLWTWLNT